MTRSKVKLAFIENDASRKATFKKRKKGLIKKVDELATLCNVDACALIYSPFDELVPEVWPSPLVAQRLLAKFCQMPPMESTRRMEDQETFLRRKIEKVLAQTDRAFRANKETETKHMMFQCLTGERALCDLNVNDLDDVSKLIGLTLNELNHYIGKGSKIVVGESSSHGSNLLLDYQEKNPTIDAMMNMDNSHQHQQIDDRSKYVNVNLQLSTDNFVISNNNGNIDMENKVANNNNNNNELGL